ncbi:60S acidic ribosomal protein P2-alpha [Termitomyces sp. T112]|nr:60S acidic ribosomal protein P2-alpha [Termitomyces sp. T112]
MDPYRPNPSSNFLPTTFDHDDREDQPQNAMKAPKRKRLAKACDACHKSKRRCDGTAPCSNCYYAVKPCTYTDASGRPVPAPRPFKPGLDDSSQASTSSNPLLFAHDNGQINAQTNMPRKRFRNERGTAVLTDDICAPSIPIPIVESSLAAPIERPSPMELDHALTRELTNLFFTHCHPARLIIHKPTFTAHLAHNRVPLYLLHAMCALAAPLSKQPHLRTTPSRFAGQRFAQEARSLMFDGAGRLICERTLATAQALCLLQFHDIKTMDGNRHWDSRYHDLAIQLIESLNVYQHDYPTLTPVPSPEFIQASIEREAVRRMFWIIHFLDNLACIYFKKPMQGLSEHGRRLRLPVDETTFELGVHSTLPEYLYLPAVRMQYSSEFGHLIRVVTIYAKVEFAMDELTDSDSNPNTSGTLLEAQHMMDSWANTLPDHLRFSEQSLQVQQSMFETSSNGGAWCWCCMHIFHASSALALNYARQQLRKESKSEPEWALKTLDLIMEMLGDRAKNSILMLTALWSSIKYCRRDDPQIRNWCATYEEEWGTRIRDLVLERHQVYSSSPAHSYGASRLPPSKQHPPQEQPPQQPPSQHRRLTDVRNPPISGPRSSSHHHDSFNRRSGSSSPTSLAVGRPLDMHNVHKSSTSGYSRGVSSQSHLDRSIGGRNHAGGSMGRNQSGNGVKRERELEGNISHPHGHNAPPRQLGRDVDADLTAVDFVSEGRTGENVNVDGGQEQPRSAGGNVFGEGQQSLPSLKSVGLLAVQHSVSMPVGLPWLANESR